ncbi:MAG: hypothetical protein DLM53_06340 [Candidatus Eremiobacter antarcticus]|nr:MAG: hypothetical protein DLM53_06340 [Candidatus Eremiobacter sp. RRmetagenome_bin22]
MVDWNLSVVDINRNCASEIAAATTRLESVLKSPVKRRTFRNTLMPLEDMASDLSDRLAGEQMLAFVSTDKDVRSAAFACQSKTGDFAAEYSARPDLYKALKAVKASNTARTDAAKKLLTIWLNGSIRSGAGLPEPQRSRFIELSKKLNDLGNKFGENIGNDESTITITKAQAAGLPSDLLANSKQTADGGYIVAVNESTSSQFMENERDSAARKTFYITYNNRQAQKNLPILHEAIGVRDELAHLLGYPTWAAYVLADRMALRPERVTSFLSDLDQKLLPKAREELATLASLKAKDTGAPNATIDAWDVVYYDNMLNKTKYAVDTNEIRKYFPAEHTIDAVLKIYSRVLSVNFARVTPGTGPNPDVLEYAVNDAHSGKLLGTFYLDLYPRPGKFSHFANFPYVGARRMPNGSYRPPVSMIIGNWSKPAPGKPSLLSHSEVEVFFHEFGHNMAALLTTAPYETLGGFKRDFVEAPSQMLENWVWDPQILKQLSANVDTGQPLPDALIQKMIAARYVDNAYFTTRQIMLATIDMDYHTEGPNVDTTAVWAKVARETTPLPLAEGIHPEAAFGHLFGYDAGYYGYLWSKVYAQDMFSAFKQGGLESPVVGMRYRQDILEPAQTYDADTLVKRFLGRPMRPDAFYEEFGIEAART